MISYISKWNETKSTNTKFYKFVKIKIATAFKKKSLPTFPKQLRQNPQIWKCVYIYISKWNETKSTDIKFYKFLTIKIATAFKKKTLPTFSNQMRPKSTNLQQKKNTHTYIYIYSLHLKTKRLIRWIFRENANSFALIMACF